MTAAHPLAAAFGDGIELIGYGLRPANDVKPIVERGGGLRVRLLWRAQAAPGASYHVFVHLLTADNQLVAQSDSIPVYATFSTDQWRAAQYILDEHLMSIGADVRRDVTGSRSECTRRIMAKGLRCAMRWTRIARAQLAAGSSGGGMSARSGQRAIGVANRGCCGVWLSFCLHWASMNLGNTPLTQALRDRLARRSAKASVVRAALAQEELGSG